MRARLGFSIAAHIDPDVLILDEVLSVGDTAFRSKSGTILEQLRDGRKTILVATHNMRLVDTTCTRAIWLEGGAVKQAGSPPDVIRAYVESSKEPEGDRIQEHRAEG
jgi:ABC-type polysaccharide/polyol phosphate transport system ATPase subunit